MAAGFASNNCALPSVQKMLEIVTRETDMNLMHMEDFGLHYAKTLRLWEFYLCYCEGGFLECSIGTAQLLLAKPAAMPQPVLGRLDA